jgi:hypothetical protein
MGRLSPPLASMRDVSAQIAIALVEVAFGQDHAGLAWPADLLAYAILIARLAIFQVRPRRRGARLKG